MDTEQPAAEPANEAWRGTVGKMSQETFQAFMREGIVCRLACLDESGWPYVVPVWFHYADGGFYIVPRERSTWARYLQADSRAALTIDDVGAPYRKVSVQGRAEVVEEPNVGGRWVEIATEMSYRYLGEHGPDYLVPTLNEPRWLFFVRPEKIRTWQGVDWAKRYKHSDWGT
ncbi:MAG: pyridoxamine 5'-phosphate oxidase family protein [Chloroflexota bacterium]|nr:pyridoxamine 5'-phosphate oxidase family protein [Chloroflexota bacterium]